MNVSINRNWRRAIRAAVAVLSAIGGGTLAFPDFVPFDVAHTIQQVDQWIVGVFILVNPFLDLGSDDAVADTKAEAMVKAEAKAEAKDDTIAGK